MRVDLTSKLKDNADPVVVIGDMEVTVKSDAPTVLQLMDIINGEEDNIERMKKAQEILFSEEDSRKVSEMPYFNWIKFMIYAIQLASNGEIDEENEKEEGESLTPITISPETGT